MSKDNYPRVLDDKGTQIRVGDTVTTGAEIEFESMSQAKRIELTAKWNWDLTPQGPAGAESERERHHAPVYKRNPDGIVTSISDFDGDVDDETGRSIGINPYVYVRWPDDDEDEQFSTTITSYGGYYPACYDSDEIELECEDLHVIKSNEKENN